MTEKPTRNTTKPTQRRLVPDNRTLRMQDKEWHINILQNVNTVSKTHIFLEINILSDKYSFCLSLTTTQTGEEMTFLGEFTGPGHGENTGKTRGKHGDKTEEYHWNTADKFVMLDRYFLLIKHFTEERKLYN